MYVYSRTDGSLVNRAGVSTVVEFNPLHLTSPYLDIDEQLRSVCSLAGYVNLYRSIRPQMGCSLYVPPRRGEFI